MTTHSYTGTAKDDYIEAHGGKGGVYNFDMSQGGDDTVIGGSGYSEFYFGATFNSADSVTGRSGGDILYIDNGEGNTSSIDDWSNVTDVFSLRFYGGGSYNISGQMSFTEILCFAATTLHVDNSMSSVSSLISGDNGDDYLIAGSHGDRLYGGDGADTLVASDQAATTLTGGNGADKLIGSSDTTFFVYGYDESTRNETDRIINYHEGDRILLAGNSSAHPFHVADPHGRHHAGDIVISHNRADTVTLVEVYISNGQTPDTVIKVAGHHDLTDTDFGLNGAAPLTAVGASHDVSNQFLEGGSSHPSFDVLHGIGHLLIA